MMHTQFYVNFCVYDGWKVGMLVTREDKQGSDLLSLGSDKTCGRAGREC